MWRIERRLSENHFAVHHFAFPRRREIKMMDIKMIIFWGRTKNDGCEDGRFPGRGCMIVNRPDRAMHSVDHG